MPPWGLRGGSESHRSWSSVSPNLKRVLGAQPLPGCSDNHGINNPLQSPHAGGLLVAFVEGSVQFITETTDLAVLLRLAIRNDGQPVVLP